MQADPIEGDLLELFVGRVLVRRPQDQLVGLQIAGRAEDGVQRVVGRHDHRLVLLAGTLGQVDHGRHQLLVETVHVLGAAVRIGVADRLGRHHDYIGRVGVGLRQRLFKHRKVLRRADRAQLAIGLLQTQTGRRRFLSAGWVEDFQVLVSGALELGGMKTF